MAQRVVAALFLCTIDRKRGTLYNRWRILLEKDVNKCRANNHWIRCRLYGGTGRRIFGQRRFVLMPRRGAEMTRRHCAGWWAMKVGCWHLIFSGKRCVQRRIGWRRQALKHRLLKQVILRWHSMRRRARWMRLFSTWDICRAPIITLPRSRKRRWRPLM